MSKLTDFPVYSAKTKKRVKYGIFGSGLIVVLVMAALLTQPPILDPLPGKISVSMKAQVYRDGVLVEERVKDDDLLIDNFIKSLAAFLYWPDGSSYEIELVDINDWACNFTFWNLTSSQTIADTSDADVRSSGRYGEGTTSPARNNFSLENEFADEIISSINQDADSFTLTIIATSDGAYDWTETGLSISWFSSEEASNYEILMCRDVFAAMAVVNEDSLVINYRFTFATGYTWNMINFLRSVFQGAAHQELANLQMYDSTGVLRETRLYVYETTEYWRGHCGTNFFGGQMVVTDSSSGIPSRTAWLVSGSALQTPSTTEYDDDGPSYYVSTSAIFMPTEAFTVRASGLYTYWKGVGDYNYYSLLFALSHSGVYVAGGTPVRATFTIDL